jgi:putative SOS response-associated peptidase YedK
MCGRFALTLPVEAMRQLFGFSEQPNLQARYNIAPTQPIAIIRAGKRANEFTFVRWGLLPGWVKDSQNFPLMINARSETAFEKPAFRAAIHRRRCIIPADAFYEWQARGKGPKQPFMIRPVGGGVMAFAGIWEHWMDAEGSEVQSAAILTTAANDTLKPIHHRMPVILEPENFTNWLECPETEAELLKPMLAPAANDMLEAVPISTRVNKVANDTPDIQERMTIEDHAVEEAAQPDDQLKLL